jgi:hypothetical protein
MNNLSDIKHQHNIVDIISQYLPLKKSGHNYFACCPFHGEKTPSFTVDESKQFYHCFGCGQHGDVISFLVEYSGLDFVEACKALGAEAELMPSAKVKSNIQRTKNRPTFSLPGDDKRDLKQCEEIIEISSYTGVKPIPYHELNGDKWVKIIDWSGEVVNMYDGFDFLAGGISYGAFTPIRVNKSNNFMLCVDTKDAIDISAKYKANTLICYTDHNMKYVYKNKPAKTELLPAIRNQDDDYLCHECEWLRYESGELTKESMKDV